MAIQKVKRGNRVYLSEYKKTRVGNKVKSEFVRYLGPEDEVKKGNTSKKRVLDRLGMSRSLRAGDVRLLWKVAQDLDIPGVIDRICCQEFNIEGPSPGKFLTAWAINRVIDPESCTQLERWVPTTDIPTIMGIEPEFFTKDAFLTSLDFVCYHESSINKIVDHTIAIDDVLYQRWRKDHPLPSSDNETVAYDLTSVLFFGTKCPLAELGSKSKNSKYRQVNLGVIVSRFDKYPIAHFVYNGARNSSSTVKNLITRLNHIAISPGTLIWDRGNVSKNHVILVESMKWKLICGVPNTSKEVCNILERTNIPLEHETYMLKSRNEHIYAVKTKGKLFGRERSVVVYLNQEKRANKINAQNDALAKIRKDIDSLNSLENKSSEAELHRKIKDVVNGWEDFVDIRINRKEDGPRIKLSFRKKVIDKNECKYGKYIILSTNETLQAEEILKAYFEKDFVEKVFRTLKTYEELEPVRHRLEPRVRGYMFVCMLGYRLLAVLRHYFEKKIGGENIHEQIFDLLRNLGRVERAEIRFGKGLKTLYLNVTNEIQNTLKAIGMNDLLKEETTIIL